MLYIRQYLKSIQIDDIKIFRNISLWYAHFHCTIPSRFARITSICMCLMNMDDVIVDKF